jgi:DNA helicase-2/ATP-dependent DNA helicase PcrA
VLPPIDAAVRKQMAKMIGRAVRDEKRTAALIAAHLRTAEPLSTWDAPSADEQDRLREERSHSFSTRFGSGFGGFGAFGAFNGKSRERERDVEDGRPGFLAFSSAKSLVNTTSAPAKPVVRLQSSVRHLHALANAPTPVTQATNLMSFTSSSNSSLAAMKALGLPGPEAGTSVGARAGAGTGAGSGVGLGAARAGTRPTGFTVPSATVSAAGTTTTSGTSATANAASAPLARGTKRLGMGRPAPWGSKRT